MSKDTITEIRKNSEKLFRTLNYELYRNLAGLKRGSNLNSIFRSNPDFGETDLFFSVKDLLPKEDEIEAQDTVLLLLGFLARSFIRSKTAKFTDKIFAIKAGQEIWVETKNIAYRTARAEIKREPKRSRRDAIEKNRKDIVLKLNPLLIELIYTWHSASEELGFGSYTALCDEIDGLKLDQLEQKVSVFLDDTEYIYRDLLEWFLFKRMGLKLKGAKNYDLFYLLNSFELKTNFPQTDLKSLAGRILNEMDIKGGENLKADVESRKYKTSEAFCIPIEPPQDIVFSIYPIGGIEDYESFFHGLGSALFYGNGNREDDFEFRSLRESASVEIFAQLFESLVFEPKWIKRYLKSDLSGDFLKFLSLRRLMEIRYYCGQLIYEIALHKDQGFQNKADFYKQIFQTVTLCEHSESDYLIDLKPFFHTASWLKAAIIEHRLRNYLKETFDEQWWREKAVGDFLRNTWQEGGRITSNEISKRTGLEELNFDPLVRSFGQAMR
ncbi:MAG: hypothetical protein ACRENF_01755 [Thermodesulfobacteriota bacterium]